MEVENKRDLIFVIIVNEFVRSLTDINENSKGIRIYKVSWYKTICHLYIVLLWQNVSTTAISTKVAASDWIELDIR